MNNPRSVAVGWVSLLVAGGISFYYAKKEIDQRRRSQREQSRRPTEIREWYEKTSDSPADPTKPNINSSSPKP